ncbi:MAG: FHA domain-containing protein, partial [Gemmatimonadetes bacterium]|nr:FHA domain-containing protein [Gemmatimonadota bacterium]
MSALGGALAKLLPRANQAGAATVLDPTRALVVGREGEGLPLHDTAVSREHAVVVRGDDGWLVRDLGSSNGTFVNGRKVEERRLRSGDLIRFGP